MPDAPRSTFLALEIPDQLRETVRAAIGTLPAQLDDAAWTRPDGWHVTLAWLDRPDDGLVDEIAAVVDEVVDGLPGHGVRAALRLDGPVRLGRVVALAVEVPAWIQDLQARLAAGVVDEVGDALSDRARRSLGRRFRPHLTLARVRRRGATGQVRAAVADRWARSVDWSPPSLALLASHTGDGPARYHPRRRWFLAD